MTQDKKSPQGIPTKGPGLFGLLKPYTKWLLLLMLLAVVSNGLNLVIPKLIQGAVDAYAKGTFSYENSLWSFAIVSLGILLFMAGQSILQTYVSEKVARDLREKLAAKISRQSYRYIQEVNPSKLLTNLTADVDSIKLFVSQAVVAIVSSLLLIVGSSVLLLMIDWRLASLVLLTIPAIGITFFLIITQVRKLFLQSREVVDWLNKVINESILGAALIRVLHGERKESEKFSDANINAKNLGMKILGLFAIMIPSVTFIGGLASIAILVLGGHFVIEGSLTLGEFTAFNSYLAIFIFPIFVIGFMSGFISQATVAYQRISEVLDAPEKEVTGELTATLRGDVAAENLSLKTGEKNILKDINFKVQAGTSTAIIGPTAAGKSQLLYLLTGLTPPTNGTILYDGKPLEEYDKVSLHSQVGFVFQDSIIFNMTVRENIAFSSEVTEENLKKAIDTAELSDFVNKLPNGLDSIASERGSSLSGGQKQRIMLARALALSPRILLLDDFTARVDRPTEEKILKNIRENYPGITIISVTQKISSIENYEQIILLMEGEILATGRHKELMETSPEYVQIYNSQRSTNHYELHA